DRNRKLEGVDGCRHDHRLLIRGSPPTTRTGTVAGGVGGEMTACPTLDWDTRNTPSTRGRTFGAVQNPVPPAQISVACAVPTNPSCPFTRVFAPTIAVPGDPALICGGWSTVKPDIRAPRIRRRSR